MILISEIGILSDEILSKENLFEKISEELSERNSFEKVLSLNALLSKKRDLHIVSTLLLTEREDLFLLEESDTPTLLLHSPDESPIFTQSSLFQSDLIKHLFNLISLEEEILLSLKLSRRRNVATLTTLCHQGLGYQAVYYSLLIRHSGLECHCFNYAGYSSSKEYPSSHSFFSSVYSSLNNREEVTLSEIEKFVSIKRIGWFIIPEITLSVDRIISKLKSLGIGVILIPNIEIIKKRELPLLKGESVVVISPTKQCYSTLSKFNIPSFFVPHTFITEIISLLPLPKIEIKKGRYLLLAGHNPKRKCLPEIVEYFSKRDFSHGRESDELLISLHAPIPLPASISEEKRIKLIFGLIGLEDYLSAETIILISKSEGIGLGLFEALALKKKVITLNAPPMNEVENSLITFVECSERRSQENPEGLVKEYYNFKFEW